MPPSTRLARIRQFVSASTPALQTSPSSTNNNPPPGTTLAHHSLLESQHDSEGEYLERSQRSRTPSEKGALLAASNAQRRRVSARAQRGRARNAQKAARKAARSLDSDHESIAEGTQAKYPRNSEDFTYQEETLVDGPTLQDAIRSYNAAQSSHPNSQLDHPLDLPSHSPRLPPPSIHGSLTIIAPPQPVAPGSGHHLSHPAIQRQMKRSINASQPAAKRPRVEHTISDAETEDEQSFLVPTSAQPQSQFRSSIQVTSPPSLSPHQSCSPSPLPNQDPHVSPENTQTIPEDLEGGQVNTQTVPETPTQPLVPNIIGSAQQRAFSQASSVSLGAYAPDPPRTRLDPHMRAVSSEQPTPTAVPAASHHTSSAPVPPSQRTTEPRPATNEGPPASQPVSPTGARSEPIDVVDDPPSTRAQGRGVWARGRARGFGPGWTCTRGGRGRGSAVRVRGGLCAMSPSERAVPRNLGIRWEATSVGRAPTLPADTCFPNNSRPANNNSQSHTQPPSTSQQTNNRPNRPPTAPTPRPTSSPSNTNQPNRPSTTCPPTADQQPPPETPAGPLPSTRTQPTAGPSNPNPLRNHRLTRLELTGSNPSTRGVGQLRNQVAATRPSDPVLPRPMPANGADLVSDDKDERAFEAAAAQGRNVDGRRRKPSSRNTHGVGRLVLQLTKLHFWAYALTEGPYQTRAVFAMWILVLWRETWAMEASGTPPRDPTDEEIQVIIAGLITNRGRVNENLRAAIEFMLGFNRFAMTPEEVALNISVFQRHHPNSFHCLEQEPERRGHYESELMHHTIALALFNSEGSVGVVFREYFVNMEPATVAFVLANIQFCLEEWSTGKHENHDLGTGQMLAKFESHLMAWRQHYSGAAQPAEEQGLLPSQVAEFRADTPTPKERDALNETLDKQVAYTEQIRELGLDEEFGETLGEGVGQGLMQELDEETADLWAQEWVDDEWEQAWEGDEGVEIGEGEEDNAGPAAQEPVEYHDDGRISARSKGKGRAAN